MKATFGHIQINVQDFEKNVELYRKLATYFEWQTIHDADGFFGAMMNSESSIWFSQSPVKEKNNRDSDGLNHIGINVSSRGDVDTFINEFMKPNNIEALFGTPQERSEFMYEGSDYYQVMFELPGTVLIEVVYTGPKKD